MPDTTMTALSTPRHSALAPYVSERLKILARITVLHPDFKMAADAVDRCLASYQSDGETICARVQGDAGCGKSHLANRYIWRHPEYRLNGQLIKPVIRVRVPPKPTIKGLAMAMLQEYYEPNASKWRSEQEISAHLDFRIKQCETMLVIVEELNHFVDAESERRNIEVANWLKIRLETSRVPFLATGLPRVAVLFDQDDQLADRFDGPFVLNRFTWFTQEADPQLLNKSFRTYLHKISEMFPFRDCIDFGAEGIAFRFFMVSNGVPRHIGKLLKQAALLAEEKNTETIDLPVLKKAYELRIGGGLPDDENPFSADYDLARAEDSLRAKSAKPASKK